MGVATNVLTEPGNDLYGVIVSLIAWGDKHLADDDVPIRLHHTTCCHVTTPLASDHCGTELVADDVGVLPGTGGRSATGTAVIVQLLGSRPG